MCRTAITIISKALNTVDDAELLLKIKGMVALFVQTMGVGAQDRNGPNGISLHDLSYLGMGLLYHDS